MLNDIEAMGELHVDAAVAFIKTLSDKPEYVNKTIFKSVDNETLHAKDIKRIIDKEWLNTPVNLLVPLFCL